MRCALLVFVAVLAAGRAAAESAPSVRPVASLDATIAGQPIVAPGGPLRVTVTETTLPAGARLPPHKHPHPRLVQVLAGRLKVIHLDTGEEVEVGAGDWVVDSVDQWHEAVVLGLEPVRMLAVDYAPPGAQVTIPRP